jgi:periplasmic protein CpxP/Spy
MMFPTINATLTGVALMIMLGGQALAQKTPPPMAGPDEGPPPFMMPPSDGGPPGMGPRGERAWWKDPRLSQKLQLSDEQSRKIEKIVRDHQMQGIDLRAGVEKQDALLWELMEADTPDKEQVLAQVDKLSQARAQLEKSHIEMLLAVRRVLTAEQAKKLRDLPHNAGPQAPGFEPPVGAPPPPRGGPTE